MKSKVFSQPFTTLAIDRSSKSLSKINRWRTLFHQLGLDSVNYNATSGVTSRITVFMVVLIQSQ